LFFFSSRRRHTISKRDWSSDVCSSDLPRLRRAGGGGAAGSRARDDAVAAALGRDLVVVLAPRGAAAVGAAAGVGSAPLVDPFPEIGRASCRERVQAWLVAR